MYAGNKLVQDFVVFDKYAHYLPSLDRRETWKEATGRYIQFMKEKFPGFAAELEQSRPYIEDRRVLPSMRLMQTAGVAAHKNPARGYNCWYRAITSWDRIGECLWVLLSGCGVGYSVQRHHVARLEAIARPRDSQRWLVPDTIEGWADLFKGLFLSYMRPRMVPKPVPDYRDVRRKGARIAGCNGLAPGYKPLKDAFDMVDRKLHEFCAGDSRRPTPMLVHEILCMMSEAVLSGGVRRSAMICFFDKWDKELLTCKTGNWWETKPHLQRANNSAVVHRSTPFEEYWELWEFIKSSGTGDPGIFWVDDSDVLSNPCGEISLFDGQFCNLTTINAETRDGDSNCEWIASFLGTLQSCLTDFYYLAPDVKRVCEEQRIIGVSMSGTFGNTLADPIVVRNTNASITRRIGSEPAWRMTAIKPEGTASKVFGSSAAGCHPWYGRHMWQRMRLNKGTPIHMYLAEKLPSLVDDDYSEREAVISVPMKAPDGALTRTEVSMKEHLAHILRLNARWVARGHRKGPHRHNVSATVSVKEDEWDKMGKWVWDKRYSFHGITTLPYWGGGHKYSPWEEMGEGEWREAEEIVSKAGIDFAEVIESKDMTNRTGEISCAGGECAEL